MGKATSFNEKHGRDLPIELAKDSDFKQLFIGGSIVRSHQHSYGAATTESEYISKSLGADIAKDTMDG